eukprot:7501029-Heterocapsa_arctica.AAC.1
MFNNFANRVSASKGHRQGVPRPETDSPPPFDVESSHRTLKTPTDNENNKTDHNKKCKRVTKWRKR